MASSALILLGGLAFNRLFIKYVFAQAFELDEAGWRKLTWRWGIFFLCLAVLNEAVWRNDLDRDLGVVQGLGHHPVDLPVRAGTDAVGDETSDTGSGRQKRATMMRRRGIPHADDQSANTCNDYGARRSPPYHALCLVRTDHTAELQNTRRDRTWITLRTLCKDESKKICAWTSARKTVLTARPERTPLSCNPNAGHD